MTEFVDDLDTSPRDKRLSVVSGATDLAAIPMTRDDDGRGGVRSRVTGWQRRCSTFWRRPRGRSPGRFTVRSWTERSAAGERSVGVDQTNESLIVGDAAVVKWATHLQDGPHPAPRRLGLLRDAGFTGMPTPWGVVTWQAGHGELTLVASVDEYLPGAVDGWTWAVDLITEAARDRLPAPSRARRQTSARWSRSCTPHWRAR